MVARLNHKRRLFDGVCVYSLPLLVIYSKGFTRPLFSEVNILPQLGEMVARLNHERYIFDRVYVFSLPLLVIFCKGFTYYSVECV